MFSRHIHQQITERILADLKAGTAPWLRPWKNGRSAALPFNGTTGKRYRGNNTLNLWQDMDERGWTDPRFATFNQIRDAGGTVRKGAKAVHIHFASTIEREAKSAQEEVRADENGLVSFYFLRGSSVFNFADVEGIEGIERVSETPIPAEVLDLTEALSVDLRIGGDRAFFSPTTDHINMPPPAAFDGIEHFQATYMHELTHWTGHTSRLDRIEKGARFKSKAYAFEELVAELGAAFLCAECGIEGQLRHADYIGAWITLLEDHDTAFYSAAQQAQAAVDFIRSRIIADDEARDAA